MKLNKAFKTKKLLVKMCVNINLGISSAGLPGVSGMASQVRGVLKHPEHHARHATGTVIAMGVKDILCTH